MSKKPIRRPSLPQLDQKQIKRALLAAFALLLASAFIYALLPNPILVDVAVVSEGTLEVTVDEEGETRIREIYTVSAPIAGKVRRSPREVGDEVVLHFGQCLEYLAPVPIEVPQLDGRLAVDLGANHDDAVGLEPQVEVEGGPEAADEEQGTYKEHS